MDDTPVATPDRLRVKRDGPRGWHWIAASNYNPAVHVLMDADQNPAPVTPKKTGRHKKATE